VVDGAKPDTIVWRSQLAYITDLMLNIISAILLVIIVRGWRCLAAGA